MRPVGKHRMTGSVLALLVVMLVFVVGGGIVTAAAGETPENELARALLVRVDQPFRGDLPKLMQRGTIRVLTSYSKTNFFFVMQQPAGFEYEMLTGYEKYLNESRREGARRVHLIFIPTPFSRLLSDLAAGRGDIAAAGLTITAARKRKARFTTAYLSNVKEIVVLNWKVKNIRNLEDLSGHMVYVRKGSSYVQHLRELNRDFERRGLEPIRIKEGQAHLATEDILEMVNAGVIKVSVADSHIAQAWAEVLPHIVVCEGLMIHGGGKIAWAVRRNNPKLRESLNAYIRRNKSGTLVGNILFKRYYRNSKWIKNPLTRSERRKLERFMTLFKKYGKKYGFDYLALAAQAYQESGLNQKKKSPAGAVGIMQIRPQTAADKSVGIRDIHRLENNIHAGVKYLAYLRKTYFNDPKISPVDRVFFSWAAYNAGPNRIAKLRGKAARMGVDPNKWFYNVENVAARFIGREPVDYVASINKYYVAYRLAEDLNLQKESEKSGKAPKRASTPEKVYGKAAEGGTGGVKKPLKALTPRPAQHKPGRKNSAARRHIVRKGDTLYGIARHYGLAVDELRRLNSLPSGAGIKPGESLRVSR